MSMLQVGGLDSDLQPIDPDPSALTWGLQDISASDAGRTNDPNATMYKLRVTQKRKLSISWTCPTNVQASRILQAFNPEYFRVRYFDLLDNAWETRVFYCGDRSAPYKWFDLPEKGTRLSTLSFDVIER